MKNKNNDNDKTPRKTTAGADDTPKSFHAPFPSKDDVRAFILESNGPLNKREIARAFDISGQDRTRLRVLLRELAEEGTLEKTPGKSYQPPESLPEAALIEITGLDGDGELRAKPVDWHGKGPEPILYVKGKAKPDENLQPGTQIRARLKKIGRLEYEARPMRAVEGGDEDKIIGIFKPYKGAGWVYPADKRIKEDFFIPVAFMKGCEDGDLVEIERIPPTAQYPKSKNPARVTQMLGKKDDPRLISLIAIHSHGIPTQFSKAVLDEAASMEEPDIKGRTDLRQYPLVTIDGADARDFDDAVFAEPDEDPKNPGGWHLIVAIADVSFYVTPGSVLDKEAYKRGNSTYFADRVVPMLPEKLSNDLCSLRPHVNRACLAVHIYLDKDAKLLRYQFVRGLMRSAARLTYEQVEAAHKGTPDDATGPLMENVITPLYKAYSILKRARELRGALEIELPERKALIDKQGQVTAIVPRERLASHQLIEEFMILANVAAAMALEDKKAPCVYRIHDRPAFDRLENTRDFLKQFGYSLPKSSEIKPANINNILKLSADKPDKDVIHTVLLRTQSQAVYSPENIGHFGLALEKYAHFTSPIRRYADLLVHRSLVRAYKLGTGQLTDHEADELGAIAQHISTTERRSMLAERDVMDRFTAQYLGHNIGKEFAGKISSVTHFGLFVMLDESGADGIVPMRNLPRDYYVHDEAHHALIGKNYGRTYRLMDRVVVRLLEADPMRASTVFEMVAGDETTPPHKQERQHRHERDHRKQGRGRDDGPRRGGGKGGDKKRRR